MTVESTNKALEALEQFRPDVLVAGIGMPKEDGYTLIVKYEHWKRSGVDGFGQWH